MRTKEKERSLSPHRSPVFTTALLGLGWIPTGEPGSSSPSEGKQRKGSRGSRSQGDHGVTTGSWEELAPLLCEHTGVGVAQSIFTRRNCSFSSSVKSSLWRKCVSAGAADCFPG